MRTMNKRQSRIRALNSQQHSSGEEWKNWLAGGFLLVVFLVVSIYLVYANFIKEVPSFDPVTGCPLVSDEVQPVAHTVVVIDKTDVLSDIQRETIQYDLANLVKHDLQVGEMLSIYSIGEDLNKSRKPIFEMCKCRDGSDASKWTENERLMRKKFKENFKGPLNKMFSEMMTMSEPAKQSPIMEVIQSVSVNTFKRWNADVDKRVIIYSDMLQHTPEFSLYRTSQEFERFRRSSYAAGLKTQLMGTDIYLKVLTTRPEFQKNKNIDFWRAYFKNTGAQIQEVMPVGR